MSSSVVIAVDGTAASGKGTLAKCLAQHFGFAHLDSGSLYRLTALAILEAGGDPKDEKDAVKGARSIDLSRAGDRAIRTDIVGQAASQVASIAAVRKALFAFQRAFLEHPPGGSFGAVMDGRDIGTVICPNATAKLFVDALDKTGSNLTRANLKQTLDTQFNNYDTGFGPTITWTADQHGGIKDFQFLQVKNGVLTPVSDFIKASAVWP